MSAISRSWSQNSDVGDISGDSPGSMWSYKNRKQPDKEAARGIENNEHLIYHPGLSSTKSAKKFGCFGILSGKPLQTIAPFELYDDIKHKQSQDFRNSTLGIIDVTIIPVKSMIQLDQKQILGGITYDIE